ncbi:DUF29 domain-containing protein [Synechococcus sp. PCC 6312]|uniref:DUF29 domain-containing protein n=1 Tax=Synechococcus sp. (strain ATCC 27167 / PCC 6312) TaxID=195253 RepID=UPI00029F052F|nr:DUF29 domain-containing protein [Synechococcus sp. PCC 6312]AFY62357.1 protein of unknown function DUF29 [Synechococcus sp. PCC 6312]
MGESSKPLYEQDFGLWAETMADLLAQGRFTELDIENLVEEVRDLSKRERDRLLSSLRLIVHHLLKWEYQPQRRSRSWQVTIQRERNNIRFYLKDSPVLKRYLTDEWVAEVYENARLDAYKETNLDFPKDCPYNIAAVLERPIELV